jgi:Flp pilus assembly pilin Flp
MSFEQAASSTVIRVSSERLARAPRGFEWDSKRTQQFDKERVIKEQITRMYVKASELGKRLSKGQTMTEYALILAAVAIVVFITYEVMGQHIGKLVNNVDSSLTTT